MKLVVASAVLIVGFTAIATIVATTPSPRPPSLGGSGHSGADEPLPTSPLKPGSHLIATVDGIGITRDSYNAYAGAFVDPSGELSVEPSKILDAVINQALVSREATRRGITVSDAATESVVSAWYALQLPPSALERAGGSAALRERSRMFLTFKAVKAAIVVVHVSDDVVRAAQAADPDLASLPFEEVGPTLRARLEQAEVEHEWEKWLASQRFCSTVVVVDPTFDRALSHEAGGCQ